VYGANRGVGVFWVGFAVRGERARLFSPASYTLLLRLTHAPGSYARLVHPSLSPVAIKWFSARSGGYPPGAV